ncbi:hypothetical protein EDD85DRAFT_815071 [Armillaria nabsnona]|nr:hypothetical protein EDD85DRAFT_815071 [Armillaria nabsnona]
MSALAIMETSPAAFLAVRYSPTAAACLMIWDHLLTLDQEIDAIWIPRNKGYLPKLIYVLNRYLAEGVLLYTAYVWGGYSHSLTDAVSSGVLLIHCTRVLWLFTVSSTVMVGLLQFIIAMRVYKSWDNQKRAGCVLLVAFSACISAAIVLTVITVIIFLMSKRLITVPHLGNVCFVRGMPRTVPALLATLLAFDVLIVLMVLYRALEKPRRTHIEAINSFHRDGARLYLVLLWLLLLIVSIISENEINLSASWALNTNIGCRVHLRVEGLKHLVDGEMPLLLYRNTDDDELYYR